MSQATATSHLGQFIAPFALDTGTGEISPRRLSLLEAIGELGSISAAAKAIGITYKAAWDAVEAVNNLAGHPLVAAQHGGRGGGGAVLTDDGRKVVEHWQHLRRLQQAWLESLESLGKSPNTETTIALMRRITMRSSARNVLHGVVDQVVHGAVNSEVTLRLAGGDPIHAIVTRDSAEELELEPGREAQALIKASWIILMAADETIRTSARNRLMGRIKRVVPGEVNAEVIVELAGGNTLVAIVTLNSVQELGLQESHEVCALIKASHVILGVQS